MNQPRVSPATQWYESRNQELQSELESLKAQLAKVSEQRDQYATFRRNEEVARKASEARVRELRELLTNAFEECAGIADSMYNRRGFDVGQEIRKRLNQNKELAALRSAPPSGQDSALTDIAQNMRSTAGSWYAQLPFANTNAGEERKDLAKVPAAPRKLADSSVGDGVVTTEHLEDSQGTIPAEDTSSSRLRSMSGSAHCSSKAGLGGETAPTADGLSPQDSDGDVAEQQVPAAVHADYSLGDSDRIGLCPDDPNKVHRADGRREGDGYTPPNDDVTAASIQSGPQDSPSRSQEAVLIPPTLWTELRKFLNRRMERDRWLKEQVLLMQGLEDCADPERRRAMNFCPMCHETGNDFDRRGNYRGECVCVKPAKEHGVRPPPLADTCS